MASVEHATGGAASGVADRISSVLPTLPSAMRRVADLILAEPSAPLTYSITELAERAGTSAATVTRFCRALGFPGYIQFRVGVAADSGRASQDPAIEIGNAFSPEDSPERVLSMLVSGHIRSLRATAGLLDLDQVTDVADRIARAKHVDIYGMGGSGTLGIEFQERLYRVGVNAHAWRSPHEGLASAALHGAGSVAIALTTSGETKDTNEMLECAAGTGAYTVALTSNASSTVTTIADVTLLTAVPARYLHPGDLAAKHAKLLIMDLLYLLVINADHEQSLTFLTESGLAVVNRRTPRTPAVPVSPIGSPS